MAGKEEPPFPQTAARTLAPANGTASTLITPLSTFPAPAPAHPTLKIKPIIKHSASYAGPEAFSRSSSTSTSTTEDDTTSLCSPQELHPVRSSSSLPTRPPSPCLSVKFAPLPSIEPRKRKSNVRLGVAARSRMIAARRGQLPPNWTEVDEAAVQGAPPPPPGEDPFEVFGRFVFSKLRGLARKHPSQPTTSAVVVGEICTVDKEKIEPEPERKVPDFRDIDVIASPARTEHADEPQILTSSPCGENVGGVWEDEVGEHFQLRMKRVSSHASVKSSKEEKRSMRASYPEDDTIPPPLPTKTLT